MLLDAHKRFDREPTPSNPSYAAESPFHLDNLTTVILLLHLSLTILNQDFLPSSKFKELLHVMLIAFDLQVRLWTKRLKGDCDLNLATVTEHVLTLICVHFGAKFGQLMILHTVAVIRGAE